MVLHLPLFLYVSILTRVLDFGFRGDLNNVYCKRYLQKYYDKAEYHSFGGVGYSKLGKQKMLHI